MSQQQACETVESDEDSEEEFQDLVAAAKHAKVEGRTKRSRQFIEGLFFESVVKNRLDRIQQLLKISNSEFGGNLVESTTGSMVKRQPLHVASVIQCVDRQIVRALCEAGAPLNETDTLDLSPAKLAVMFGRFGAWEELRAQGADMTFLPELFRELLLGEKCERVHPIVSAAFYGNVLAVKNELESCRTGSSDEQRDYSGKGEEEIVVCEQQTSPDEIKKEALKFAAWRGHCGAVKVLLAAGVPAEFIDEDEITPLMYAVRCGHTDVARCLLESGACANQYSPSRVNLMETAISTNRMDLLRLLLEFGKAPDLVHEHETGFTALMKAVARDNIEAIRILLSSGADVNFCSTSTALILASGKGSAHAVRALLAAEADVNATSSSDRLHGVTALMMASSRCMHRCTRQLLLSRRTELNRTDSCGRTALHHCCLVDNTKGALLLLRAGIDKSIRTTSGWTASEFANRQGLAHLSDLTKYFFPSLEDLCLRQIRRTLPLLVTRDAVEKLPLPRSMKNKLLFLYK